MRNRLHHSCALAIALLATPASSKEFDFSQFFSEILHFNFDYAASFVRSSINSKLYEFSQEYNKLICAADWTEVSYPEFGQFPPLKVRQYYCDQKWFFERLTQIGKKLQDKFSGPSGDQPLDSSSSPAVLAEVETTLSKYKSSTNGNLELQLSYSLEYGVMRLRWRSQREVDYCPGVESVTVSKQVCDSNGCTWVTTTEVHTFIDYVFREPSYRVYRVIDGSAEEIASFKPVTKIVRGSLFSIEKILEGVEINFDKFFKEILKNVEIGKTIDKFDSYDVLWYDSLPDLRPRGSTLSYRVVGYAGRQDGFGVTCPEIDNYYSETSADSNGDGKIDFVPPSDYAAFFRELFKDRNASISAMLSLMMER